MEKHIPTLKAESIPLSSFDMQGSFSNIPYAFFYENRERIAAFMSSALLKEALGRALEDFPILAGHLRARGTGRMEVVVDPDHVNLPEFIESTCDTITYDDIKSKTFAWDSWPADVATVGGYAVPAASDGEVKFLNVHVVRLKDNTGAILFINIPHYAVDGSGYFAFIQRWATLAASLSSSSGGSNASGAVPSPRLVIDRACIKARLPTERRALDSLTDSMYSTANFLCDTLAWLAPTTLGKLLSKLGGLSKGEAHLFHISKATLNELRDAASKHIPSGHRLSSNDLLVALLSKTYVQSQLQPEPKAGWFSAAPKSAEDFFVRIPCDARPRLGMREDGFTGNLLIPMLVKNRLDELAKPTTAETLATAALKVRETIGSIDAPLIASFHDIISKYPSSHMRPLAFASRNQTTSMVTTSQVGFGLYNADFGFGTPGFVSLTKVFEGGYTLAAFLPTAPHQGEGINVLLTTNPVAMGNILKNEFWREKTTLLW
ncbi:transferase family protein [Nemania serpens]|nr:transferase family protein [Nemania serpens]